MRDIIQIKKLSGQAAISSMVESLSRLLRNAISNNVQVITVGEGIGLKNIHERLWHMFGELAGFSFSSNVGEQPRMDSKR